MKILALVLLAALGAAAALAGLRPIWANAPARPVAGMDQVIHDYLMKNPEVILAAVKGMGKQEAKAQQDDTVTALAGAHKALREQAGDPVAGNPRGDVTIVEFFDYRCPYCKHAHETVQQALQADPNVRLVYKEFPILSRGSIIAAQAALAARQQGKYLELHAALMGAQGDFSEDMVLSVAERAGLDTARLKADMKDPEILQVLKRNQALARELSISGTPSFIIGDQVSGGAIELDEMLAQIKTARANCESCKG